MWETFIAILAAVIGAFGRHFWFWARVKQLAAAIVKDPDPTTPTDPRQAVIDAVLQANRRRITSTTAELQANLAVDTSTTDRRTPPIEPRAPEDPTRATTAKIVPPTAPKQKPRSPVAFPASVEFWRETLADQANGVPVEFLLAWLTRESGGNPCSVGFAGQRDTDGLFKFEAGIGQQFFSASTRDALDDVAVGGVALRVLREPCSGQNLKSGKLADLSEDVKVANVQAFLSDVERFRATVHSQLGAISSQVDDESVEDFWMFVKLQHALPSIPRELLGPAAESGAGDSWDRFRGFVQGLEPAELKRIAPTSARFAFNKLGVFVGLNRLFDNAEATGKGNGVSFFDFVPSSTFTITPVPALALVLLAKFVL